MSANPRSDGTQLSRTATTAERQSLDNFDAFTAANDERTSTATTAVATGRSSDSAAVLGDGSGEGEGGGREGSMNSGLSVSGTHDRAADANLVQTGPEGGEDSPGETLITVGAGSDSRSDLNMLVPADEPTETTEAETDSGTVETRSGVVIEIGGDTGGGGDLRTGGASGDTDSPLETASGIRLDFDDSENSGANRSPGTSNDRGEDRSGADAPPAQSLDVFDAVTAIPSPVQPIDGPSNIPGRDSLLPDRAEGESGPGSLAPESTSSDAFADQFGLDLKQDGSPKGFSGDQRLEIPEIPTAGGLPERESLGPVDVGIDFANLGGSSSLDGRTNDAFDGASQGAPATGPADPTDMISTGNGQKGSPYTTNADSDMSAAEAEVDAAIKGMQEGTKSNPYISIQLGLEGSLVDVPADDAGAPASDPPAADTKSNAERNKEQWNHVGEDVPQGGHADGDSLVDKAGEQTWLESLKSLWEDQAEGDLIGPSEGGLGSQPTGAIGQSILIGLGGQRGGDVDPQDDTEPATSGEMINDPYESVIDPGPDGFAANPDIDSSVLGGPLDAVAPYLADE